MLHQLIYDKALTKKLKNWTSHGLLPIIENACLLIAQLIA